MFGLKGTRKKERRGEEKGTENEIMVRDVERDRIEGRGRGGKERGRVDGKNFFLNRDLIMRLKIGRKVFITIWIRKNLKREKTHEIKSNIFIKFSKKKCLISKIW